LNIIPADSTLSGLHNVENLPVYPGIREITLENTGKLPAHLLENEVTSATS